MDDQKQNNSQAFLATVRELFGPEQQDTATYETARAVYEKLNSYRVPAIDGQFQDEELASHVVAVTLAAKALMQIKQAAQVTDIDMDAADLSAATTLNDEVRAIKNKYL